MKTSEEVDRSIKVISFMDFISWDILDILYTISLGKFILTEVGQIEFLFVLAFANAAKLKLTNLGHGKVLLGE